MPSIKIGEKISSWQILKPKSKEYFIASKTEIYIQFFYIQKVLPDRESNPGRLGENQES